MRPPHPHHGLKTPQNRSPRQRSLPTVQHPRLHRPAPHPVPLPPLRRKRPPQSPQPSPYLERSAFAPFLRPTTYKRARRASFALGFVRAKKRRTRFTMVQDPRCPPSPASFSSL